MSNRCPVRDSAAKQLAVALLLLLSINSQLAEAFCQRPSSSRYSLAVDEVALSNGKKLYGIVTQRNANSGLSLILERAWLEKTYPELFAMELESELKNGVESRTQNLFRLEAWWKSRVEDTELVSFIDHEMERIQQERLALQTDGIQNSLRFMVLHYHPTQIKDVYIQSPANHRIAGLGWKHQVERVTTRTSKAIKRELDSLKVDTNSETFDLSTELSNSQAQSESQWKARVALIEYRLRTPLRFQGIGSNLTRVDEQNGGQDILNVLAAQLMGTGIGGDAQVNELLAELGLGSIKKPDRQWWKRAANVAETEGYSGFLVSRIVSTATSPSATVESCFFAKIQPGEWKQVICLKASADRNEVDQVNLDRIKNDPNVSQILRVAKGLGLDSKDVIEQAIRQGAATERALNDANDQFAEFLERCTKQSDGPLWSLAH